MSELLQFSPPMSLEMEQCVLGSMILDGLAIETARALLVTADFFSPAHQVIFDAVLHLTDSNSAVDAYTVQEEIKRQGVLDQIGGSSYLLQIQNAPSATSYIESYCREVDEKATLRRLDLLSLQIRERIYSSENPEGIESWVNGEIQNVFQSRSGDISADMSTLLAGVFATIEDRQSNPTKTIGLDTGLGELNFITQGLQPESLVILAARPSMGKTALANQIALNIAKKYDKKTIFISAEMSREQIISRMISSESAVRLNDLKTGYFNTDSFGEIGVAFGNLSASSLVIPDMPTVTISEIKRFCRTTARTSKIGLVVVDYLQYIESETSGNVSTADKIGTIVKGLKQIAREFKCTVLALSQLNRECEKRNDRRPQLSDIRDSGSVEAEGDVILSLYRDDYYHRDNQPEPGDPSILELGVLKNRDGKAGFIIPLRFYPEIQRITDGERGDLESPSQDLSETHKSSGVQKSQNTRKSNVKLPETDGQDSLVDQMIAADLAGYGQVEL